MLCLWSLVSAFMFTKLNPNRIIWQRLTQQRPSTCKTPSHPDGSCSATTCGVMEDLCGLITSATHLGNRFDQVCTQLSATTSGVSPCPPQAASLPAPVNVSSSSRKPFISIPARYSGGLGQCGQFLYQCSLENLSPLIYPGWNMYMTL